MDSVVQAIADATAAQPDGSRGKASSGTTPKWNQKNALLAGSRGRRWLLKVKLINSEISLFAKL